ncbi:uncharacterized protein LOC124460910 [Drosophila willistoni]|uniref:uncharacterized protein LOC124460910 n=1 Tax=Drosophila willistoni TaxID=7260 RepID=UPI001F07E2DF|nr:uncharacterized protein LOC124460910 [Drosophila willistoni]
MLLNTRGPKHGRRLLLSSVIRSTALYAVPSWIKGMETRSYRRSLESTHRLRAIRVCSAFRTISDDAALVIAGLLPIDEYAAIASDSFTASRQTNSTTTDQQSGLEHRRAWQSSLRRWQERKHGAVNFYLTQLLSGHGCFSSYLKRFNHDESDECTWCGAGIVEDASHVLQHCPRFDVERCRLQNVMGELVTSRNLIRRMTADPDVWEAVSAFAVRVTKVLRKLER